jgi:hypothetical protein
MACKTAERSAIASLPRRWLRLAQTRGAPMPKNRSDRAEPTVILEALAEGGFLTIVAFRAANSWRFRVVRDECTLADLLSQEDRQGMELRSESKWVDSWRAALALLDKYPWHRLYPGKVHPDFHQQIWAAAQERFGRERREDKWAREQLSEWQRARPR